MVSIIKINDMRLVKKTVQGILVATAKILQPTWASVVHDIGGSESQKTHGLRFPRMVGKGSACLKAFK